MNQSYPWQPESLSVNSNYNLLEQLTIEQRDRRLIQVTTLKRAQLLDETLAHWTWKESQFHLFTAANCKFEGLFLFNCMLIDSHLQNCKFESSIFNNLHFEATTFSKVEFHHCLFLNMRPEMMAILRESGCHFSEDCEFLNQSNESPVRVVETPIPAAEQAPPTPPPQSRFAVLEP